MQILFICSGNHGKLHHGTQEQINSLINSGINIEVFLIIGRGFAGYLKNIVNLRKAIHDNKYDLLHAIGGHSGLAATLTLSKKRLCVSYLGSDLQGTFYSSKLRGIINKLLRRIIRLSTFFPDRIIVKSARMLNTLPERVAKKCHVVPNGVNFNVFKPMEKKKAREFLGLSQNKNYILFLGNPKSLNKNYALLEKAYNKISDGNVELITPFPVEHSSIPFYMNACDVLVLTSYNEGSPNIIKEAMACNCPIISTDVGDVHEIIAGTENCYITEFNDQKLAALIMKVLESKKRSDGRSRIQHLSLESTATKIKTVYEEILNL